MKWFARSSAVRHALRYWRLRGITASPAIRPPASFDITLNFPYNSAELTPDLRAKLDRVAKVFY